MVFLVSRTRLAFLQRDLTVKLRGTALTDFFGLEKTRLWCAVVLCVQDFRDFDRRRGA